MGFESVPINSKGFPDISGNPLSTGYFQSILIVSDIEMESSSVFLDKLDKRTITICNIVSYDFGRGPLFLTKETFFSFERETWITLPPEPDPKELVSEGIESLIENEEWEELRCLMERIFEVIKENER